MQTRCEEKVVRNLYEMATDEGKNILETIFGKDTFNTRPIGVWCYDKSMGKLIKPEDWTNNNVSGGVVVITDNHAFRVLPLVENCGIEWASPNKNTSLCRDIDAISGKDLTDKIIKTYKNVKYVPKRNVHQAFSGCPAAEFCKSAGGYLPSVVELKIIAKYYNSINAYFHIMSQPILPLGWYWSSVEYTNSNAYAVDLYDGEPIRNTKFLKYYVCVVASFQV